TARMNANGRRRTDPLKSENAIAPAPTHALPLALQTPLYQRRSGASAGNHCSPRPGRCRHPRPFVDKPFRHAYSEGCETRTRIIGGTMLTSLQFRAATARAWLFDAALPLWWARGFDTSAGCFHEALNLDGSAAHEQPRRTRVQARQVVVY